MLAHLGRSRVGIGPETGTNQQLGALSDDGSSDPFVSRNQVDPKWFLLRKMFCLHTQDICQTRNIPFVENDYGRQTIPDFKRSF